MAKKHRDYTPGKPSVTTIISRNLGWKGPGLIQWAHTLGKEGRSLKERDDAARKGSCVHDLVAAHFAPDDHGDLTAWSAAEIEEAKPNAVRVIAEFEKRQWTPIAIELPMESESVAGTVDAVVRDASGKVIVVDLKTSRTQAGAAEWVIQVSAYNWLWRLECIRRLGDAGASHYAVDGAIVHAPFGADLAVLPISAAALFAGEQAFRSLLQIHELSDQIKVGAAL